MGSCKFSRISIDWGLDILLPQNFIGGVNYIPIGMTTLLWSYIASIKRSKYLLYSDGTNLYGSAIASLESFYDLIEIEH